MRVQITTEPTQWPDIHHGFVTVDDSEPDAGQRLHYAAGPSEEGVWQALKAYVDSRDWHEVVKVRRETGWQPAAK